MGIIITRRLPGSGIGIRISDTIAPSATKEVDSFSLSSTKSVKWLVSLEDSSASKYWSYEILASHKNSSVFNNRYGMVGESISHDYSVKVSGSNLALEITNNEINSIDINVVRITTT